MIRMTLRYKVDHSGDVHGVPVWSPSSHTGEAITKNVYISPGSGSLVGDKNTQFVV